MPEILYSSMIESHTHIID